MSLSWRSGFRHEENEPDRNIGMNRFTKTTPVGLTLLAPMARVFSLRLKRLRAD